MNIQSFPCVGALRALLGRRGPAWQHGASDQLDSGTRCNSYKVWRRPLHMIPRRWFGAVGGARSWRVVAATASCGVRSNRAGWIAKQRNRVARLKVSRLLGALARVPFGSKSFSVAEKSQDKLDNGGQRQMMMDEMGQNSPS